MGVDSLGSGVALVESGAVEQRAVDGTAGGGVNLALSVPHGADLRAVEGAADAPVEGLVDIDRDRPATVRGSERVSAVPSVGAGPVASQVAVQVAGLRYADTGIEIKESTSKNVQLRRGSKDAAS